MKNMHCRSCGQTLEHVFVDLGMSPLSNCYLSANQLENGEKFYPLKAYVCDKCYLVQLGEYESPETIFSDYAYLASYSNSWLLHCEHYVNMITQKLKLSTESKVIEIASNDGYLLQYFVQRKIPCLGIEPAANAAAVAREKGVATVTAFFGTDLAKKLKSEGEQADLLLGNNVLAHVPAINDFVAGMKILLKPSGVITMEFPHLLNLIRYNQFDTIYHEHFSYLSFSTVSRVFAANGLRLFDVEKLQTHGGSLRIYATHAENNDYPETDEAKALYAQEEAFGLNGLTAYHSYFKKVQATKRSILSFLIQAKNEGKRIVGYGAPAKGNTLLNYCGVRDDFIDFTVDRSPLKYGKYLPGTHIAVRPVEAICQEKPDYLVILPWNLKDEIMEQCAYIRNWGGKFVTLIPEVEVL